MVEAVLEALTGEAGGMVAIFIAAAAGYTIVVKHILPYQQRTIEGILVSHAKDREAFVKAISKIDGRMDVLERDVGTIKRQVGSMKSDLKKKKPNA